MEKKNVKLNVNAIKPGDLMAFTYYVKVNTVLCGGTKLIVTDLDTGLDKITIEGQPLIESSQSADFFGEEEKVSKTRAAEILVSCYGRPFTVCFDKATGEERILRGRLIAPEPLLGRSKVEDLEQTSNRMRLVDHRTIKWLIIEGVKYTVKD
jgi:hypothetical protein